MQLLCLSKRRPDSTNRLVICDNILWVEAKGTNGSKLPDMTGLHMCYLPSSSPKTHVGEHGEALLQIT